MASTNLWRLSVESYCAPYAWLRSCKRQEQLKYILKWFTIFIYFFRHIWRCTAYTGCLIQLQPQSQGHVLCKGEGATSLFLGRWGFLGKYRKVEIFIRVFGSPKFGSRTWRMARERPTLEAGWSWRLQVQTEPSQHHTAEGTTFLFFVKSPLLKLTLVVQIFLRFFEITFTDL